MAVTYEIAIDSDGQLHVDLKPKEIICLLTKKGETTLTTRSTRGVLEAYSGGGKKKKARPPPLSEKNGGETKKTS